MKTVGKDIYLQRGETWSLDFSVMNAKGDPYMIATFWDNPYLAITVTAARYQQKGDYRITYWLDLDNRLVEQQDGSVIRVPLKRFISTEALSLYVFSVSEVIATYGTGVGGKIVLDKNSDFDVTNYLFYTDVNKDGKRIYKYVKDYTVDQSGNVTNEVWEAYDFRIIKQFNTLGWVEQHYLYDIKVLAGESLSEYTHGYLLEQDYKNVPNLPWNDTVTNTQINRIVDNDKRKELMEIYDSDMPLMPNYDTKLLILPPSNMYISANIQGGT